MKKLVLGGCLLMATFGAGSNPLLRTLKTAHAADSRTWTFTDTNSQGQPQTITLTGTYLRTNGFDSPLSQAFVVLQLSDGRIKSYPLPGFSAADKDYVAAQPKTTYTPDPDTYNPKYTDYNPTTNAANVNFYQTPHFVFYWGNNISQPAQNWNDPAFRDNNFKYFEEVWNYNAQVIHAPMPYEGQAQKYKLNVYITGTGLPNHPDGFAFGGDSIVMHPGALLQGSSVVPHEFTHVIQFYSGGFRDNPNVGWFWECHANWNCFQFYPSYPAALGVYAERMHYELSSSRMNYGSWPFLQYLAEDPNFGTKFCFDIWKQNLRDGNGASTETPFETIMRLGTAQGKFQGGGLDGFGDVIGGVAARNVTWDYVNQYSMSRSLRDYYNSLGRPTGDRTVLRALPDKANTFAPMYSQAPRQYGVNIVELNRTANTNSVTVNFVGIPDETEGSAWRLTIVAVDATGKARYSPMWRTGSKTFALQSGEKAFLAIAATPTVYKVQEFRPGFNRKRRHPYELTFTNATPVTLFPPTSTGTNPTTPQGATHSNGGGFVESTASVDPDAYVGPNAKVLGKAQVRNNARIDGNAIVKDAAIVRGNATVTDNAVVGGAAVVGDQAKVSGSARVRDASSIDGAANVTGNARVLEYIRIHGDGTIGGDALVKGFGDVFTAPDAPIGGGTIIGEDTEMYVGGRNAPILYGLIYGFNDPGILSTALQDNNYLYAHWSFNDARTNITLDSCADNNGVLRGATLPTYSGGKLNLSGNGQYVVVGGTPADTSDITIDAKATRTATTANQRLFTFGTASNNMYFTPRNSSGRAAFVITKNGVTQQLQATTAMPANAETRVTITLIGNTGKLYLNGTLAATNTSMTFNPEDIASDWGVLGADMSGQNAFKGSINDIAIYRKGFTTLPPAF